MKGNVKFVVASLLSGAMIVSTLSPVFAQGYQNYNYNSYGTGYNQAPSYPQTQQTYNQGYNQSYGSSYLPPLQGRVMLPVGAQLPAMIASPISSQFARSGDLVTATLGSDITAGGMVVLPAGSRIEGRVVDAISAGRMNGNGRLNIRFNTAITPNGKKIPISGKIATEDGTGILIGGTTSGRMINVAKNTAIGAGTGAALGTAMGAIAGGRPGRGAWSGTAIGGGLGLLSNFFTKGEEAVIPGNTRVDIVLDQALEDAGY